MNEQSSDGSPWSVDLLLLDIPVRVTSLDRRFLKGLAMCYDDVAPVRTAAPGFTHPVIDVVVPRVSGDLVQRVVEAPLDRSIDGKVVFTPGDVCSLLNEWAARSADGHHVFHAGAVARGGRAILLPGVSHAGKTTLTVALSQTGFELVSDEVGAVRVDGYCLTGFPRRPSIRPESFEPLGLAPGQGVGWSTDSARFVGLSELGVQRHRGAPSIAAIVFPSFRRGAKLKVQALRPSDALVELTASSCSLPRFKEDGLDWLITLVGRVPSHRLVYGDLEEAVGAVVRLFKSTNEISA